MRPLLRLLQIGSGEAVLTWGCPWADTALAERRKCMNPLACQSVTLTCRLLYLTFRSSLKGNHLHSFVAIILAVVDLHGDLTVGVAVAVA